MFETWNCKFKVLLHEKIYPFEKSRAAEEPPNFDQTPWEPDPDPNRLKCFDLPFAELPLAGMGFDLVPVGVDDPEAAVRNVYSFTDIYKRAAMYRSHKKLGQYGCSVSCRRLGNFIRVWRTASTER